MSQIYCGLNHIKTTIYCLKAQSIRVGFKVYPLRQHRTPYTLVLHHTYWKDRNRITVLKRSGDRTQTPAGVVNPLEKNFGHRRQRGH